jgi:hypothetical protein
METVASEQSWKYVKHYFDEKVLAYSDSACVVTVQSRFNRLFPCLLHRDYDVQHKHAL